MSHSGIDPNATAVVRALRQAGYETYIVGGAVRDLLTGMKPKDFDISTMATPEEVKRIFGRSAQIIGRRFKIVHVHKGRHVYEVSTFRRTPTADERKQRDNDDGVMVWSDNCWGSPREDAWRRDFTVNALFLDPLDDDCIIDFCQGRQDVEAGIVRSLGDPMVRFGEDPVRMLRALKLVAQHEFRLNDDVAAAIRDLAPLLAQVSQRRLYEEILKLTHKPYLSRMLELCDEYGLLEHLLPRAAKLFNDEDERDAVLHLLTLRDERIEHGASLSRAYSLAALCYRWVEIRLNHGSKFGDGWDSYAGHDHDIRDAVEEFMAPHNVTRLIAARVRDTLILVQRIRHGGKALKRLQRHPDWRYAVLLYETLADIFDWPEVPIHEGGHSFHHRDDGDALDDEDDEHAGNDDEEDDEDDKDEEDADESAPPAPGAISGETQSGKPKRKRRRRRKKKKSTGDTAPGGEA
ncbi:MAG: poly(A) polymerase [Verrucomicrobiota bacterium]|jgi:poly(A) polymerase